MHLRLRHDAADRAQRSEHAELEVVVHAEVAVAAVGVLPRDREHREALVDEVLDQRVVRRQVEHVVLHDPGRHDEHRLGVDLGRRRLVLDQLDQPVAQHDAARRHGDVAADLIDLGTGGRQVGELAPGVFDSVLHPAQQVHAALFDAAPLHDRVGRDEVRRRRHVEQLPRRESHHLFVMAVEARNGRRRALPPLLLEQEVVLPPPVRQVAPARIVEALVLRQRLDAVGHGRAALPRTHPLFSRELRELPLLGRRRGQVHPPVHEGAHRGRRRHSQTRRRAPR